MGTVDRRQRELEARRTLILEKSRKLFFERGYDNVSVADICEAVEFGRSALYALFRSKEEIYAHILLEALDMAIENGRDFDSQAEDIKEEFTKFAQYFFNIFRYNRDHYEVLFYFNSGGYTHGRISPQLEAVIEEKMDLALDPLRRLLRRGIENGVFRKVPLEQTIRIYWSSLEGIIRMFICDGMEDQTEEIESHCLGLADLLLRGLAAS